MTTSTPTNAVFIDTNIWLYAFITSQDPHKTQRAQNLIQVSSAIVISIQVINEVCVNLIKRENFTEKQIRNIISDFYNTYAVIELDQTILLMASALRDQYSLSYWDGLIVACAFISGASTLYSEDMQDGLTVNRQLKIINPLK
jgi:predicted nucleic acid-binding protein